MTICFQVLNSCKSLVKNTFILYSEHGCSLGGGGWDRALDPLSMKKKLYELVIQ